jgi:ubiquinone/menaquinone biosynthesis C-methylase UbiE
MAMDFHSGANRLSYTQRESGEDWAQAVRSIVDPRGARVVDVGCGGGSYSTAWLDLGASSVVGVDFSAAMLSGAREHCGARDGLVFRQGDACATGLPDACADIVFERALVHHLDDLPAAFREARRLLAPGGALIVQDRTVEDATLPGTVENLRGYFFEKFPFLLEVESRRRPSAGSVEAAMLSAGFSGVRASKLREVRRRYRDVQEVRADLLGRTGRSILHELDDAQLASLANYIGGELAGAGPIVERDAWTLWTAER